MGEGKRKDNRQDGGERIRGGDRRRGRMERMREIEGIKEKKSDNEGGRWTKDKGGEGVLGKWKEVREV